MAEPLIVVWYIFSVQMALILGVFFLALIIYLSFVWSRKEMIIKSWNVPGPLNLPIIGAAYHFFCKPEHMLNRAYKLQCRYPEGGKLWIGHRLFYTLHEPDHIEKVLNNSRLIRKDFPYTFITDAIGEGLISASPHRWRKHRKLLNPSFNQRVMDTFVKVFAEKSQIMTEVMMDQCGQELDLYELLSKCTLDILCETAMGLNLNIQRTDGDHARTFDKILIIVWLRIVYIWNHNHFVWKFLGYEKKLKVYLKKFNDLIERVIKDKMQVMESQKNNIKKPVGLASIEESDGRLAFLDFIMEGNELDFTELKDEVRMFLFAGTDTTTAAVSFALVVLGVFPEVQQKVYEEVIRIVGVDRKIEAKDLPHLVYLERVIKETLRLFPVAPFFLRKITEDVDVGDFVIPKGASTYFGLMYIHRNPKYWPDPLKFDPDRFLPEEVAKRHPCTYIPFSYGPRNCIGMKYAMMNAKTIISSVVRKYHLHCGYKNLEDIKLKANILIRYKEGSKLSVTPREN